MLSDIIQKVISFTLAQLRISALLWRSHHKQIKKMEILFFFFGWSKNFAIAFTISKIGIFFAKTSESSFFQGHMQKLFVDFVFFSPSQNVVHFQLFTRLPDKQFWFTNIFNFKPHTPALTTKTINWYNNLACLMVRQLSRPCFQPQSLATVYQWNLLHKYFIN